MKRIPESKVARWPQKITRLALIYACCFFLTAAISFGVCYAYFTAKTEITGNITVGRLEVQYVDGSSDTLTELDTTITRTIWGNAQELTNQSTIVPGDVINIKGNIKNTGSIDAFVVLQAEFILMGTDGTTEEKIYDSKFYDLNGTTIEYDTTNKIYTTPATSLEVGETKNLVDTVNNNEVLKITYTVNTGLTSEYSGRTFRLKLTTHALQSENLKEDIKYSSLAIQATNMMLQNTSHLVTTSKIYGNTVQNIGSPSPEAPAKIESVGERTNNLFNIKNVKHSYGDLSVSVDKDSVILTATGTKGAQFAENYVKNLDATQNYTLSFKAKKILRGETGTPNIKINIYGSNDDATYISVSVPSKTPSQGTEYSISATVTGYKHYRFYIYNNSGTPVTVGEQTIYYDMQFEKGTTATEYEPYGYKIPITMRGKNLFDGIFEKGIISAENGNTYDHDTIIRSKNFIPVKKLTEYTFSCDDLNVDSIYLYEFGNDYSLLSHTVYSMTDSKVTIITKENTKYIKFSPRDRVSNVTLALDIKVQLEEGTTATDYEQYIGNTTYNIYLDQPLRKVGDYADYIEIKDGVVTVVRKIVEKVFDGSENIQVMALGPYPYTYLDLGTTGLVVDDVCLSTHHVHQSNFSYTIEGVNTFRVLNSYSNSKSRIVFRFCINGEIVSDVEAVKNLLAKYYNEGNAMSVYYAHATGKEEKTIIDVSDMFTLAGNTIYEFDTNIQPSDYYFG